MDTGGSIFGDGFNSGDDIPITFAFFDTDNVTPLPMTGNTLGITVKTKLDDSFGNPVPDSEAIFTENLPGDNSGVFLFQIPGFGSDGQPTLAPGTYYFDVKQWDQTGKRSTIVTSSLPINESVTLRAIP